MANFTGTNSNDIFSGTIEDDFAEGQGGHDTLRGDNGNDELHGGDDDDILQGDAGNDRLYGGAGRDSIDGGAGDDLIFAGEGDDYVTSNAGSDVIDLGSGANWLSIYRNNPDSSHITVTGGANRERITVSSSGLTSYAFDLGGGDDEIGFSNLGGAVTLTLGAGADTILFNSYYPGKLLTSYPLGVITVTDFEAGPAGDRIDWMSVLPGILTNWNHSLNPFGTGHFRLLQSGADTLLQQDRNGGGDVYETIVVFKDRLVSAFTLENFDGYSPDGLPVDGRSIDGTVGNDRIDGTGGADFIRGHEQEDRLEGGGGDDRLDGGDGNDELYGEIGNDQLNGGAGHDHMRGGPGDDTMNGGDGNDTLEGDSGTNVLDGGNGDDSLYIFASASTGLGGEDNDQFWFYGIAGEGSHVLDGGGGNDTLNIQTLRGRADVTLGAGADRLVLGYDSAGSVFNFGTLVVADFATGAGGDVVQIAPLLQSLAGSGWNGSDNPFGSGHARLFQSGADTLLQIDENGGGNSWETAILFTGRDVADFTAANLDGFPPDGSPIPGLHLIGTEAADNLTGGNGADTIEGLDNDDALAGGGGGDLIRGGAGHDWLTGDAGNDRLEGGDGSDTFYGGTGDDLQYGGEGNDHFRDNDGADAIYGEGGDDNIFVQRGTFPGQTVIADGGAGNDEIGLNFYYSSIAQVNGGDGNDLIDIMGGGGILSVTLGSGSDTVRFAGLFNSSGHSASLSITDFAPGAEGDRLDLTNFFAGNLSGWDPATNPFETGFARLFKRGANTVFQVDRNGGGNGYTDLFTLLNVDAYAFTADNLGYVPLAVEGETRTGTAGNDQIDGSSGNDRLDGGPGADTMWGGLGDDVYIVDNVADLPREFAGEGTDEVRTGIAAYTLTAHVEKLTATNDGAHDFRGNSGANLMTGGAGEDLFRLQDGGDDDARGNAGNDGFFFGAALTAADKADGGAGRDYLALQGNYTALTLGTGLVNWELMTLLSGSDTRFGLPGTALFRYNITTVDANVTAANGIVVVDAGQLLAGENLTFDSSAETDGSYRVWGGFGIDTLKGGLASDYYYFAAGRFGASDTIDGGTGARNQLQLLGDYTIAFGAGQLANIQSIVFLSGRDLRENTDFDYNITMHDQNLAAGVRMTIDGGQLRSTEHLVFNGSAEADGTFRIFGGQGNDDLRGGQGGDTMFGGAGKDRLEGGAGADTYAYRTVSDSTSTGFDTIHGFVFGTDTIDLAGTRDAYEVRGNGTLSQASFDADLAAAMAGTLDVAEAVLFTADAGDLAGRLFLVVDENGIAGYQAGEDYVIELAGVTPPMGPVPDFIV